EFRGLNDGDMAMAQGMTSLAELTLGSSPLVTDAGLAQWRHATGLRTLWLKKMNVCGTGFHEWPEDHPLEALSASGTAITAAGLKALGRLRNLSQLHVRTIQLFGGPIEVDLACFLDTPSLEAIALQGSYVTTQASLDRLITARPELAVACRVEP
ncbi:MAG: hypothetical protein U1E05_07935, partial [Patescibacteria group bacterium]|nr:hypothetical protein [Patescibacteria group bacterium]